MVDLWSQAEPSGTQRAAWRLRAVPMGVATAVPVPRAVSVDQIVSHQVLCSLFAVRAAW